MTNSAMTEPATTKPAAVRGGRGHDLRIESITHRFGDFIAIDDVALDINAGELVALLGPSGCGKSTLQRIVAGFIRQTRGSVRFDGDAHEVQIVDYH
jgi:ABC-type Fe3+/spermidine/putrescine transport system ATPase subunit